MLKIRLMGTKSDIAWFQRLMKNHLQIRVLEISDLYANKGTDKNYRCYMEIIKKNTRKRRLDYSFRTILVVIEFMMQ